MIGDEERFVLDCSVTMAWCFEDENSAYADGVWEKLYVSEALVPALWHLEVVNTLLVAERRGRLTPADSARFLHLLHPLRIVVELDPAIARFEELLTIGRQQSVSAYDATYLALAMRRGLPLATLDQDLRRAATTLGVQILKR